MVPAAVQELKRADQNPYRLHVAAETAPPPQDAAQVAGEKLILPPVVSATV